MATYTYELIEGIMDNVTLKKTYRDGVHVRNTLIAHDGYALYDTTEELYTDPETGETYPPTYSYQVVCPVSFDYTVYRATPITEGMEVFGGVPNNQETI